MRFVLSILLVSLSYFTFAQSLFMQGIDTPWSVGEFTLYDGTQFKGIIKYNQQIGSINFKSDSLAKESRTFAERDIVTMSFIDGESKNHRKFYSFPMTDEENKEVIFLFEVVHGF